jgi:hypothetical protein
VEEVRPPGLPGGLAGIEIAMDQREAARSVLAEAYVLSITENLSLTTSTRAFAFLNQ